MVESSKSDADGSSLTACSATVGAAEAALLGLLELLRRNRLATLADGLLRGLAPLLLCELPTSRVMLSTTPVSAFWMRRVASRWVETGVPSTCVTMSPGISPVFSPTEPCRTICTRGRTTLSLSEPLSIVMPCSGEGAAQKRGRRRVEEATARAPAWSPAHAASAR